MVENASVKLLWDRIIARMAELADAPDSKSGSLTRVGVRPSLRAPMNSCHKKNVKNKFYHLGVNSLLCESVSTAKLT